MQHAHAPTQESRRAPAAETPAANKSVAMATPWLMRSADACACGGGCPTCVQRSADGLEISQPDDPLEIEADRIAEAVVSRSPLPEISSGAPRISRCPGDPGCNCAHDDVVQRSPAEGEAGAPDGGMVEEEEEDIAPEATVARSADPSSGASARGPPRSGSDFAREVAVPGGGSALDLATRERMEQTFGASFEGVRVHTGSSADALSRAVHAQAFTVGSNLFFAAGRYRPGTQDGDRLLAHELTHTIQQRGSVGRMVQRREVCDEQGVCRSEPDEEQNYTPNVAAVAGASLMPPGDCTWAEHRALQDIVDRDCDRERRCTQNDSCATIWERIQHNAECIRARSTINARCFRGGNIGHITALANAVGALANCWAVYNRKCRPVTPPVRVPVPVPETRPQPTVDRTFMERMAAITGLTGTALVIYLIVSEGSRLFPPRNLVPIP